MIDHKTRIDELNKVKEVIKNNNDEVKLIEHSSTIYDENGFIKKYNRVSHYNSLRTKEIQYKYFINDIPLNDCSNDKINKLLEISNCIGDCNSPYESGIVGFMQYYDHYVFDVFGTHDENSESNILIDRPISDHDIFEMREIETYSSEINTRYFFFDMDDRLLYYTDGIDKFWMSLNEKFKVISTHCNTIYKYKLKVEYCPDNETMQNSLTNYIEDGNVIHTIERIYNNKGDIIEEIASIDSEVIHDMIFKYDQSELLCEIDHITGLEMKVNVNRDDKNRIIRLEYQNVHNTPGYRMQPIEEYEYIDDKNYITRYKFLSSYTDESIFYNGNMICSYEIDTHDDHIKCNIFKNNYNESGIIVSEESTEYKVTI